MEDNRSINDLINLNKKIRNIIEEAKKNNQDIDEELKYSISSEVKEKLNSLKEESKLEISNFLLKFKL